MTLYENIRLGCTDSTARAKVVSGDSTPSACITQYHRLDAENILVAAAILCYSYRGKFNFECYFDNEQLPHDGENFQWVDRHELLSVSVSSNVPGHDKAGCFVTDGDSKSLATRITALESMNETA